MTALYSIFGCIFFVCVIIYISRKWGAEAAQKDAYEAAHDDDVEARKIDDAVARLSDDDLADELRPKT
tara:strand:+ start:296 stop:499 length:204 start_codon:yes stop_codon:yes gene_type:complete